jgi:hypothetical protein
MRCGAPGVRGVPSPGPVRADGRHGQVYLSPAPVLAVLPWYGYLVRVVSLSLAGMNGSHRLGAVSV